MKAIPAETAGLAFHRYWRTRWTFVDVLWYYVAADEFILEFLDLPKWANAGVLKTRRRTAFFIGHGSFKTVVQFTLDCYSHITPTMSTDVNEFDQYLKSRLYRDLLFRTIVWLAVSLATGILAITLVGSTALSYFERVGNTLAPLVNSIGVGGLLMCLLALFLKDLEFVSKNAKTVDATRGMLGGFARRLAGDISLWTLGALVAMLSAMIIALLHTSMSKSEVGSVCVLAFLLVLMTALTSIANVFVRRSGPTPWANRFKNSAWLVVAYAGAFAFLVGRLLTAAI